MTVIVATNLSSLTIPRKRGSDLYLYINGEEVISFIFYHCQAEIPN